MDIYTVRPSICSNCKKPFQWFSGRGPGDMTCELCTNCAGEKVVDNRISFQISAAVYYLEEGAPEHRQIQRNTYGNFHTDLEANAYAVRLLENALEEANLRKLKVQSIATRVTRH